MAHATWLLAHMLCTPTYANCQHQPALALALGTHRRRRPWLAMAVLAVMLLPKLPPLLAIREQA